MNAYLFFFDGTESFYLPKVIVTATRKDTATKLAKKEAEKLGLNPNTARLQYYVKLDKPTLIYSTNGEF